METLDVLLKFYTIVCGTFLASVSGAAPSLTLTLVPYSADGIVAGRLLTLRCSAENFLSKPKKFQWNDHCGEEFIAFREDDAGVVYSENRIKLRREDDQKMCFCSVVIDNVGVLVRNVTFNVIYGPQMIPPDTEHRVANVGEKVLFSCVVWAKPRPNIYWTARGVNLPKQPETQRERYRRVSTKTFSNVSLEDDGRYICWADNSAEKRAVQKVFRLSVRFPPTSLQITVDPNSTMIGTKNVLRCSIDSSYPPIEAFRWIGRCGIRPSGVRNSDGVTSEERSIVLRREHDATSCRCEATYVDGNITLSDTITHTVHYAPVIIYPQRNTIITAIESSDVELNCTILSRPLPEITWSSDTGEIIPRATSAAVSRHETVSSVNFRRVGRQQAGVYVCSAKNGIGLPAARNFSLDVQYGPDKVSFVGKSGGIAGEVVTLTCTSGTSNPPDVELSFTGTCGRVSVFGTNATGRVTVTLTAEHRGKTCTCVVIHRLRNLTKSVTFEVFYSPRITEPATSNATFYTVVEKTGITLTCNASGNPRPNITWMMLHQNVTPAAVVAMETAHGNDWRESRLKMMDVSESHAGIYECVATNVVGHDSRTFNLSVSEAPVTKPLVPDDMNVGDITLLTVSTVILGICLLLIVFLVIMFIAKHRRKMRRRDAEENYLKISVGSSPLSSPSRDSSGFTNNGVEIDDDSDLDAKAIKYLDFTILESSRESCGKYDDDDSNFYHDSSYDTVDAVKQSYALNINSGDSRTISTESIEPDYDLDSLGGDYSDITKKNEPRTLEIEPNVESHVYSNVRKRKGSVETSENTPKNTGNFRDRPGIFHNRSRSTNESSYDYSTNSLDRLYAQTIPNKATTQQRSSTLQSEKHQDNTATKKDDKKGDNLTQYSTNKSRPLRKNERIAVKF